MAAETARELTLDIGKTLSGLKAIQREARKAAQELRELEASSVCDREIDRLATFILREYPDEPGKYTSESAVDVAIRLLDATKAVLRAE